jgi:predicted dehydrogenase
VLEDPDIDCVFIVTRHDSHVDLAVRALEAGKHVWVEKPLAIDLPGLRRIENAYSSVEGASPVFMAGFNRRFAPHVLAMKEALDLVTGPRYIIVTVRAGALSRDHWLNDPTQGGGRIVGEAIHFVDLARHLAGSDVRDGRMMRAGRDGAVITLEFEDSSVATIHYVTSNHPGLPKEEIEVHVGERSLRLDNYRSLTGRGFEGFEKEQMHPVAFRFRNFLPISAELRLEEPDKGHAAALAAFLKAVETGRPSPIPFWDAVESNRVVLELDL